MPEWLHIALMIITPILSFVGGWFYGMAYQLRKQHDKINRAYRSTGYDWQRGKESEG